MSYLFLLQGTKLNYRPGKRPKLDKGEPSSDVSSMEFDQVFEENGEKEPVSADKAKTKDAQAGDAGGDDGTQFAESFNPFMTRCKIA